MVPAIVRTDPVPTPYFRSRFERPLAKAWMRRQAEIVVRREVDDAAVIERRRGLLLVFEDAKRAVQPLLFEGVQFCRKVRERVAPHDVDQPFVRNCCVKPAISP